MPAAWNRWGRKLEGVSLAELRDGVVDLQALAFPPPEDRVYVLDEAPRDYESTMREFFADSLAGDADAHFVQLWIAALELWVAVMTREDRRQ